MFNLYECDINFLYYKYIEDLKVMNKLMSSYDNRIFKSVSSYGLELIFLFLREIKPNVVIEIGPYKGWSTSLILIALAMNNSGLLYSFDIVDYCLENIKYKFSKEIINKHFRFIKGEVAYSYEYIVDLNPEFVFIDGLHTDDFCKSYVDNMILTIKENYDNNCVYCIHDCCYGKFLTSEAKYLFEFLYNNDIKYIGASKAIPNKKYLKCRSKNFIDFKKIK